FKAIVREQYFLLRLDEERAVAAIPALLPEDAKARAAALSDISQIVLAKGPSEGTTGERLALIEGIFGADLRARERDTRDFRIRGSQRAIEPSVSEPTSEG